MIDKPRCRCPWCRRMPRKLPRVSELEGQPMSEESKKALEKIVSEAFATFSSGKTAKP